MTTDGEKITAWIAANLSLSALGNWTSTLQSVLNVLVPLGQFTVAVVTVIYVIIKIRKARKK